MTEHTIQTDSLTGSPSPLKSSGSLDQISKIDVTPTIGVEFARGIQVEVLRFDHPWDQSSSFPNVWFLCEQISALLKDPNSDSLIRDLAILSKLPPRIVSFTFFFLPGLSIVHTRILICGATAPAPPT